MTGTPPPSTLRVLLRPLVDENPITKQILGVCSALAVTNSLETALVMGLALTCVLVAASGVISALRRAIPRDVRLIVQITIIASLVIVTDQLLLAFQYDMSKKLSVFVSLIVTNCIVLGRTEAFAMHNRVGVSMLDALGNSLGYTLVLVAVGTVRELLGTGRLLGAVVLPVVADGGWYREVELMQAAPSAFFVLGLTIWALRSARPTLCEAREPRPLESASEERGS